MAEVPPTKTMLRRIEQYKDRWSSYGMNTGIVAISDKMSAGELRQFEIFQDYDDKFLEKISPDVSLVAWREGSVLFEEGTYLDLAFVVVSGTVEVFLQSVAAPGEAGQASGPQPIFDASRTMMLALPPDPAEATQVTQATPTATARTHTARVRRTSANEITFLASMDFDLPRGGQNELGEGELFGEIGAMSGWPQSVTARTASDCQLLQIRVPALRLMKRKSKALKHRVDQLYRDRALIAQLKSTPLLRHSNDFFLEGLKQVVELVSCEPDEVVVREGEPADAIYLVRSGFVKLAQRLGEGDLAVSYLSKGMTLGEVEILVDGLDHWESTATSVEYAELVKIPASTFHSLLKESPEIAEMVWQNAAARLKEIGFSRRNIGQSEFTQVALDTGLVQGSSILVIDLEQCTRCDDCVRACAATHEGRPRFVREGNKIDQLLVAKSCYHCRDPVCLIGCPTGAIHRAGVGEVVDVEDEICIGCSTCANNCPYDAIQMHEMGEKWPADMVPTGLRGTDRRVASKCDLCYDTGHGPACVSNCPQGCAYRVSSLEEIQGLLSHD
ncbi:MAG: cyclic nucleotide-binding domain-containing protein [Acidobacteriota bacterium]